MLRRLKLIAILSLLAAVLAGCSSSGGTPSTPSGRSVIPGTLDFAKLEAEQSLFNGSVSVLPLGKGMTSKITLQSSGTKPAIIESVTIANDPGASVSGGTCQAGDTVSASCSLSITQKAITGSKDSAEVNVVYHVAGGPNALLSLPYTVSMGSVSVSPEFQNYDFGVLNVNQFLTKKYTVTNNSDESGVPVSVTKSIIKGDGFSHVGGCDSALAAHGSCELLVNYAPVSAQPSEAKVTLDLPYQRATPLVATFTGDINLPDVNATLSKSLVVLNNNYGSLAAQLNIQQDPFTYQADFKQPDEISFDASKLAYRGGTFPGSSGTCSVSSSIPSDSACTVFLGKVSTESSIPSKVYAATVNYTYDSGKKTGSATLNGGIAVVNARFMLAPSAGSSDQSLYALNDSVAESDSGVAAAVSTGFRDAPVVYSDGAVYYLNSSELYSKYDFATGSVTHPAGFIATGTEIALAFGSAASKAYVLTDNEATENVQVVASGANYATAGTVTSCTGATKHLTNPDLAVSADYAVFQNVDGIGVCALPAGGTIKNIATGAQSMSVALSGDYAYVGRFVTGIKIADLKTSAVTSFASTYSYIKLVVDDGSLYALGFNSSGQHVVQKFAINSGTGALTLQATENVADATALAVVPTAGAQQGVYVVTDSGIEKYDLGLTGSPTTYKLGGLTSVTGSLAVLPTTTAHLH